MPEQINAPLPDEIVEQMEEAAKKCINKKFGNRHATIIRSVLSGGSSSPDDTRRYHVTVTTDSFIMNVQESVHTALGDAEIISIYTSEEDQIRVSVEFTKEQVVNHTEWNG